MNHSHEASPQISQISDSWDPSDLLEACVAITAETHLDRLLTTTLQILTKLVPAAKALILLPSTTDRITDVMPELQDWMIVATYLEPSSPKISLHIEAPTAEVLPLSCIEAVATTRLPLQLKLQGSATTGLKSHQDSVLDLNSDPYLLHQHPHQILCIPFNEETVVTGLVYVEPQPDSWLTQAQLQNLDMIGRQIAITIRRVKQLQNLKIELRTRTFELQYTRTKLNTLLENSQFGIFIARREDGLVLEINQRGLQMLGVPVTDDIVGIKRMTDYGLDTQQWYELMLQLQASTEIDSYELQLTRADGLKAWVLLSVRLNSIDDCVEGVITDINARKQAEFNLRNNAELIHQITDNLPALISYIDNQECYRFVNKYYEEWYGIPAELIVGCHVRDLVGADDYAKGYPYAQSALRGERVNFELAKFRQDGQLRYLNISLIPHFDTTSQVQGYFVLAPDITDRKVAEERHQTIFENSTIGIFQTTPQGHLISANPALAEIFGYASAEAMITQIVTIDQLYVEPERRIGDLQQLAPEAGGHKFEAKAYRADGTVIWISENVRAVRDSQGQLILYEGFVQEVTDRKQAEEAIRSQQEFLRQVIDASPYAIFVKDWEGRFVSINQAGADLYSGSVEEIIGCREEDLYPDSVNLILDHQAVITTFKPKFIPEQPIIRSGKTHWIQTYLKPLMTDQVSPTPYIVGVSVDITERKQAEARLQEYLSLLQATLESTVEGMIATDLRGNPLTYNQRFLELWSLPEKLLQPGQRDHRIQVMARLTRYPDYFLQKLEDITGGEATDLEMIELQDGRVFERYTQPVRIEVRVVGRVWSYRDVTQRQRIEDALRESEARLRLALSAANMTAWDWDLVTGEERSWPDSDLLGMPGSYTASLNWVHPDDRSLVHQAEQDALTHQSDYQVEFRLLLEDGSLRWQSSRGNLLYNRNGKPIRMVGMSIDITERKAAEEALKRSEATNRALIEAIPDLLIRMDGQGRILSVKKGADPILLQAEGLWLTPDDPTRLESLTIFDTLNLPQAQKRLKYIQKVLDVGELHVYEQEMELDSEVLYEEVRVAVSGVNEVLIIIRDITSRKLAEVALQQAKETAEAASRSKSTFLANMSHELRTPMNAILGFSQLMARDPNLTTQQQQSLSIINRSGEHLLSLINAVLEMSKIESGRMDLIEKAFDLFQLLQMLEELFQPRIKAKQLYLQVTLDQTVPRYVVSDESKLRQILINLMGNALKFTERGGIAVRVRYMEISSRLEFEVEDTGEGIDSTEQDQLFQPFMQTASGIRSQGGTGLGLAICQQYVELMGGSIRVQSQVFQGSTFTFDISVNRAAAIDIQPERPQYRVIGLEAGQPQYRILIADDQVENRELLSQLLAAVGFATQSAVDGETTIKMWDEWDPHLIWMDIRMPKMDGFAATRYIRALPKGQSTVIIALTASAFEYERSQMIAAGCNDSVSKPLQEYVIFEKIATFLPVRYIYESTTQTIESVQLSSDQVTSLLAHQPYTWLQALQRASIQLDTELVQALISDLPDEFQTLKQLLTDWAEQYRFDRITDLIQPLLADFEHLS